MFTPRRHRKAQRALAHLLFALLLSFAADSLAQKAPVPSTPQPSGNCTHPDPATRPDCPAAIAFLAKLQEDMESNNRQAVASLVHYPLLVTVGHKRSIRSRAELLAGFDHIFTAALRAAILSAGPDDVWGNAHGFMVARGAIWFDAIIPPHQQPGPDSTAKYPIKLITINPVFP